jgi:hypothetical protein
VRPVRPELPLPFGLSQAPRTKPSGSFARRQAVHVRHMRYAIQVSRTMQVSKYISFPLPSVIIIIIIVGTCPPWCWRSDRTFAQLYNRCMRLTRTGFPRRHRN